MRPNLIGLIDLTVDLNLAFGIRMNVIRSTILSMANCTRPWSIISLPAINFLTNYLEESST